MYCHVIQTKYKTRHYDHFARKTAEGRRVTSLFYPRPTLRERVKESPYYKERIRKLLKHGYALSELAEWFRLETDISRVNTNTPAANKIWEHIKACYDNRCAYCGKKSAPLTKDHITPVSKGGEDSMCNIVPACKTCNSSKKAKLLFDWDRFLSLQLHLLGFN